MAAALVAHCLADIHWNFAEPTQHLLDRQT
jgi:hypothetical protein